MSEIGEILEKWLDAKEKIALLEKRVEKYKAIIGKEMNKKETDKITENGITVSRRRNSRTYVSKESMPDNLWKEYATSCSFDVFTFSKK